MPAVTSWSDELRRRSEGTVGPGAASGAGMMWRDALDGGEWEAAWVVLPCT